MHSRDKIEQHLIQQKAKSIAIGDKGQTQCMYRGDNGLMCAVGCLVEDKNYNREMESCAVVHLRYEHNVMLPEDIAVQELAMWQRYHDGTAYYAYSDGQQFSYQSWLDGDEWQHPTLFKQYLLEQGASV